MKMLLTLLCALNVSAAYSQINENCVSTNCDLYREEKAKFEAKLASIGCLGPSDARKECNQVELAKISVEFEAKIKSIFTSPNVKAAIKNDVQFNGKTNTFSAKTQAASGVYELVPVLSDPNIGVHWGGVVNNMAQVDRLFNIDPNAGDVKKSNWYLTQWKKTAPLMLSNTRKDPILTNSNWNDAYLGKPLFEINSPVDKFGVETSLYIFKNPADGAHVFEIVGRNGWLNNVGGSNVFLSSDIKDWENNNFNSDINLTFNGKISKMKVQYNDNSKETKNEVVVAQSFAAFTALHSPPNGGKKTNLFVQVFFADTRGENFLYKGCYMHGDSIEIVYTHNLDGDFATKADDPKSPLIPKKYNLNKYLCDALKQNFSCPANYARPDFLAMSKDLSHWKMTGFYTGVETQAAKAGADQNVPGPIRGQVEMGLQYSNMRVSANTNIKFPDCDAVTNRAPDEEAVSGECSKGVFTNDQGKKIEYSCGCGDVSGGVKQANGCYHKEAANQSSTPVVEEPVKPISNNCTTGQFTNAQGKLIDFSCGGCDVYGGTKQPDGCYHKISADQSVKKPGVTQGTFCVGVKKTKWICNAGAVEGWSDVGQGCYHLATNEDCDD